MPAFRPVARLMVAVALSVTFGAAGLSACGAEGDTFYEPKEEDFRGAYDQDANNTKRQSWDDYWGWVKDFYRGNFFDAGWTRRSQGLIEAVSDEGMQQALRKDLNALGRLIAAEWAKDNEVRKIDTRELAAWGDRLRAARKRDDRSGNVIQAEIVAIRQDAERELSKPR